MNNLDPILKSILETKRPTKNNIFNQLFATDLLSHLKIQFNTDEFNNITIIIGDRPQQMFTAHTDTVERNLGKNNLVITEDGYVYNPDGILGADDGAGMFILIKMILAAKPGVYVFFSEEEQGRIGSKQYQLPYDGITHCISFDRKGTADLVTEQMGEPGCSTKFIRYFEDNFPLPYYEDPTGIFTDSYSFFDQIPECINLSVGYENEHTKAEFLDLNHLNALVEACIEFDWTKLPVDDRPTTIYEPDNRVELEEYICRNPDIIAELLKEYGLTFRDVLDYEESLYGYPDESIRYINS